LGSLSINRKVKRFHQNFIQIESPRIADFEFWEFALPSQFVNGRIRQFQIVAYKGVQNRKDVPPGEQSDAPVGKPCGTRADEAVVSPCPREKKSPALLRSPRLMAEERLFLPARPLPPVRSRSSVSSTGGKESRVDPMRKGRSMSFYFGLINIFASSWESARRNRERRLFRRNVSSAQ
jgi:hypothetical protein